MIFALAFAAMAAVTHWIVITWAISAFPRLTRWRRWLYGAAILVIALQPITRALMVGMHESAGAYVHAGVLVEIMVIGFAAVPVGIVHLASRLLARRAAAPAEGISRRQILEGAAGSLVLAGTGSAIGWGIVRGRHAFQVEELAVKIAGLPKALDGYAIAQISDVHCGVLLEDRTLVEGLAKIKELRPDLLVVTGDLVDFDPRFAGPFARMLVDLGVRDGVYAIMGNHDHYAGASLVAAAAREAGVRALVNEGARVRAEDGGGFALLGVDDLLGAKDGDGPSLVRAKAMVPGDVPHILLSHQPKTIEAWAGDVALQLSGHTHGGQINPGFSPVGMTMRYIAGRYEVNGTTLYVNRGFGTVGPPSRVGAPPEVTKIVLVAG